MPGLNRRLKVRASQAENVAPGDMRETLVDNPLDWREDGSILEGDPAWAALMDVMNTGEAASFTQNADGTWAKGV